MRALPPARSVLVILLALAIPLAGCTQQTADDQPEPSPDDGADGDQGPTADCDHAVVTGRQDNRSGHVLVMSCDGQGPGQQQASLACPEPGGADLEAGTDLGGGQIEITVTDADGAEIAQATLSDTDGDRRGIPLDKDTAQAGDWTVTIERTEPYDGEHRLELWCPTG